jgi:hypothetical protein
MLRDSARVPPPPLAAPLQGGRALGLSTRPRERLSITTRVPVQVMMELFQLLDNNPLLRQFPGTYGQARYGFAIGMASAGDLWMQNGAAVSMYLKAKRGRPPRGLAWSAPRPPAPRSTYSCPAARHVRNQAIFRQRRVVMASTAHTWSALRAQRRLPL